MATKRTWIVVADASRAKIYLQSRAGAGLEPALDHDLLGSRAKSSEEGADRPGRVHERQGQVRHAMQPTTDPQRHAKAEFARVLAEELERGCDGDELDHIVLVAPPQLLGDLRKSLAGRVRDKVIGELDKDLAKLSIHDLPAHLSEILHFAG